MQRMKLETVINDGPINTVALLDSRAELTCGTSQGYIVSQWLFTPVGVTSADLVYSRERDVDIKFPRVSVTLSSRELCTLTIDNVRLMDAGIYTCKTYRLVNGRGIDVVKQGAQLIVLNDTGTCTNVSTSVTEGIALEMRCSVSYGGNWAPTTEWREKKEDEVVTDGVETFTFPNASIVSTLTLLTNSIMDGKRYEFRTFFTKYSGYFNTNATNVPNNSYSWTAPPLNITYGPKNIRIIPQLHFYKVGDRLTCAVDANPAPIYEWTDHITGLQTNESVFRITESLQEQFTLTCKATNAVSFIKKQIRFIVEHNAKSTEYSANLYLLALVPTPVLLVIIAVLSFRHLRKFKRGQLEPRQTKEDVSRPVDRTERGSGGQSFDTAPASTDSYTSIPSVYFEGEVIQADRSVVMELPTVKSSAEDFVHSVGYNDLEPRETPPPTTYSRLIRSRLEVKLNVDSTVIKTTNDYVNIQATAVQSATEESRPTKGDDNAGV